MLEALDVWHYSTGQITAILNHCLKSESNDIGICAATQVVEHGVPVTALIANLKLGEFESIKLYANINAIY